MLKAVLSAATAVLAMTGMTPAQEVLTPRACPAAVGANVTCYGGRDAAGSYLLAAMPSSWNGRLIVHAHGGPRMSPPQADDPDEDLDRFAVMVRAGYAWIGPSYRRGDYGVRRAAADVEAARKAFIAHFGAPSRTILHGQSWGAQIALKTLEIYGRDPDGAEPYHAALLTNGVVAGGVQAYQFRVDLRAIYQFYCGNHPKPEEISYPVWMGLPEGSRLTRENIEQRLRECTGLGLPTGERSAAQKTRLTQVLSASGVSENTLLQHLNWATGALRSLIDSIGGGNPFDNSQTTYSGVPDAAALNAGVERFRHDPVARARLDYDSKPTGLVVTPVMSVYARGDQQVSPALQTDLAATFRTAGRADLLIQISLDWTNHSRLPDDVLLAALDALHDWTARDITPDATKLWAHCRARGAACATLK